MATASGSTSDPLAVSSWEPADADSKSERYMGRRLAEASAELKGIALTTFFLGAAVALLAWLLLGVLADHWLLAGGLPRWLRWAWMAAAVGAAVAAAVRWVLPLIRYRVNLVYAARALEREHPGLHNDVVNAVLVQARSDETTPLVVRSLRRRAARQLSKVRGEGVVDYTPALRLAAVLATLVVAAVIYELAAPKSLLTSTVRLIVPWAGLAAPSRTRIEAPTLRWRQPGMPLEAATAQDVPVVNGAATLIRGRQLLVTTAIRRVRRDERPLAIVTPRREVGATASWRVPLVATKKGEFEATLPDAARGLDESVDLVIAAGDAQTEPIRVTVVDAPTIIFREATYHYPKYTGQEDRTVEWQGDLSAVEGTDVTIVAETNQPVDRAWIDFGGDGKGDIELKPGQRDLARVRGRFTLRLNADRNGAEHPKYRLLFKPKAAGPAAREPLVDQLEHRIDVMPDLAPEVSIVFPEQKVVRVRPDAAVTVRVRAVDPDFGLASVVVETRLDDGPERPGRELLAGRRTADRRMRFEGDEILVPERLGAGAGAVLQYRAVAADTRPKAPNVTATEWQSLVIDIGAPRQPPTPPPLQQPEVNDSGDGGGRSEDDGGRAGRNTRPGAAIDEAEQRGGESVESDEPRGQESDPESQALQPERKGGGVKPSGDSGEQGHQQPKSKQNDPKPARDEGLPEQGEDQGSADGGKSQDGTKGKTGHQAGQRQQDGSSDGVGGQPEGSGGVGQAGDQQRQGREGAEGAPQRPGTGGREKKPGGGARGGDPQAAGEGGGRDRQAAGRRSEKNGGQGERREKVASDGTADGDAMDRILEHRRTTKSGADGQKRKSDGISDPAGSSAAEQASKQEPCDAADGKPCGKPGCPSCGGGTSGGAAGGDTADGTSGTAAHGGQPGPLGTNPTGTAGSGGRPASAGGGADGAGQRAEVADRGDSGAAGGSQRGDDAGDATGRERGSQSGAAESGRGSDADRAASGRDSGGAAAETASSKGNAAGDERGSGSTGKTAATDKSQGAGEQGAGEQGAGEQGAGEQGAGERGSGEQMPGESAASAGGGGVVGGGQRQQVNAATGELQDRALEWTEQDLSHARNAADLALEHLRRSVDSGDRAVLDELGWTVEQAREFLSRWERMRQADVGSDRSRRRDFDEAVKSLGLRPKGARRTGDEANDVVRGQSEGRRSRPPSDYREQFKAFLQGASVE